MHRCGTAGASLVSAQIYVRSPSIARVEASRAFRWAQQNCFKRGGEGQKKARDPVESCNFTAGKKQKKNVSLSLSLSFSFSEQGTGVSLTMNHAREIIREIEREREREREGEIGKATRVIKRLISRKGEIQKDRNAVRLYSMRLSDANRSLIANVSFPIHRSHDRGAHAKRRMLSLIFCRRLIQPSVLIRMLISRNPYDSCFP